MRLKQILPEGSIPSTVPYGHATAQEFGSDVAAEVGRAGARLAETGFEITDIRLRAEAAKKRLQQETDAALVESQLHVEIADGLLNIRRTATTDEEYKQKAAELIQKTEQGIGERVKDPQTLQRMQPALARIFSTARIGVTREADAMFMDQEAGKAVITDNNWLQTIGRRDWQDGLGIAQDMADARRGMEAQRSIFGNKATEERIDKFQRSALGVVARKHAYDDPVGFRENLDRYTGVAPQYLEGLAESAERRQLAAEDKAEKKLEHQRNIARTDTFARLSDAVLGTPTTQPITEDQLRADPGWELLEGGQREHLVTTLRTPKLAPSDPQALTYWRNLVYVDKPTVNEKQIQADPRLNSADAGQLSLHVMSRRDYWRGLTLGETHHAEAERHRAEDKTKSDIERRHGEVKDLGLHVLTLDGALVTSLDPRQQTYQAAFRDALLRRSTGAGRPLPGYPRNEDPEKVRDDVLPPLVRGLRGDVDKEYRRADRQIKESKYPTPEALMKKYPGDPMQYANNPEYVEAAKRFQNRDKLKTNFDALSAELDRLGVHP